MHWLSKLSVRDMRPAEADLVVAYFHSSSSEHLALMGVERAKLPAPEEWTTRIAGELRRPPAERRLHYVCWLYDDEPVGHSHIDEIDYGHQARMHLHIWPEQLRRRGMGTEFVRLSAVRYFERYALQRLYCQPSALNDAPNRTLARAGFEFLDSIETTPSPIAFPQTVSRWVLRRPNLEALRDAATLDRSEV